MAQYPLDAVPAILEIVGFERSASSYEALAALLNRVLPEQPTCAAFLSRVEREHHPGRLFRRDIARSAEPGGAWLGVVECGHRRQSGSSRRYELQLEQRLAP